MDAMLYPAPLKDVGLEIIEEMRKQGRAKTCDGCGKPFNSARKWRAIKRLSIDCEKTGVFSWTALLCGKCKFEHEHGNREILERLNREAIQEAALIAAEPVGSA